MDGVRQVKVSYDPKCEELARYFLTTDITKPGQEQVSRLAGKIQQAIEEFLETES
jgi:hypothetical protein